MSSDPTTAPTIAWFSRRHRCSPSNCTGLTKRRSAERPRLSRTITALARLAVALICARRLTAYRYLHEGIDALAAAAPGLSGALLAARAAGDAHVTVDGTLIRIDRCYATGPTARSDRTDAG
jgi:hypothetical protein